MGDFNADCGYVNGDDWSQIRLRTDDRFDWVIPDTDDTTVSGNTHCAYDRYIFFIIFHEFKRNLLILLFQELWYNFKFNTGRQIKMGIL